MCIVILINKYCKMTSNHAKNIFKSLTVQNPENN